jgi:uncharacterized protein
MRRAPQAIDIPAPHGRLEGLYQSAEQPSFAALACHPHPLFGGTMHNHVVFRLARGLEQAGAAVVRFNFRGVGTSTGVHGGGVGEREDVRAALDFLQGRHPALPIWISGFSFGAAVGLAVGAKEQRVERLLGVGLALSQSDFTFLAACPKPMAFIQGALDEYGGASEIRALVDRLSSPRRLILVEGASHLFPGRLPQLEEAVAQAVAWLGADAPAARE